MTIATTRPADYQSDAEEIDAPIGGLRSAIPGSAPLPTIDPASVDGYVHVAPTHGDPSARLRWAELIHDVTGWDFPEIPGDREYVSRLWAEDWDSPEDSVYDNE